MVWQGGGERRKKQRKRPPDITYQCLPFHRKQKAPMRHRRPPAIEGREHAPLQVQKQKKGEKLKYNKTLKIKINKNPLHCNKRNQPGATVVVVVPTKPAVSPSSSHRGPRTICPTANAEKN